MKRLFTKPQQPARRARAKMTAPLCLAAAVLALLFFLPAARESLQCLLNRLFAASEVVNRLPSFRRYLRLRFCCWADL